VHVITCVGLAFGSAFGVWESLAVLASETLSKTHPYIHLRSED